jgi:hypothetical protein
MAAMASCAWSSSGEAAMERWAIIHDGAVENVIVWDGVSPYAPPPGRLMMPEAEAVRRGMPRAQEPEDAPGEQRHAGA